jgi:hypothetical protein
MKTKSRFVNNNKNIVYVTVQAPKAQHHTHHKSKESNSESSSISSYSRPNISVPFTNTNNLENEILREQLNNIQSNRNPSMNRIGTKINDKFRTPIYADNTFIKNGTNKEEVDVSSEADLYDAYSQKSFNMPDDVFDRLRQPLYTPSNSTNDSGSSVFTDMTEDAIQEPKPVKSKAVKPKSIKIQPIITNKPKPRYKMNKNELRAEYKDITGSSPGKMTVKQMQEAIKRYTFKSP